MKESKQEKSVILAEKIKLLFQFAADLIKDKDLIQETFKSLEERQGFALSAAPILGAFGMDYEVQEFESRFRKERAKALYDLVDCLERTENERIAFNKRQIEKEKSRDQLNKMFGL